LKLAKITTTLFGAALLFSAAAVAGENNKSTVSISEKVTVEGKTLEPGKYNVEWTGNGQNVQVKLVQGKEQVATLNARVSEGTTKNRANGYGTSTADNGTKSLTTIYVGGKKTVLEFEQISANRQAEATSAK